MDDASAVEEKPPLRASALVVSYNNVESLRLCLAALERSANRDTFEILVVDKGSRDGCAAIDSEFPSVTMLRLPRNFGATKALNIGMRTATGELMFFLVPEVEVDPLSLTRLADRLESDPDAVAVCPVLSGAKQFYRLPTPQSPVLEPIAPPQEPKAVDGAGFTAMMASKYFIRGINFLDEKFGESWSDVDLCFQIRRSGKKVLAAPDIPCSYAPRTDRFPGSALRIMEADQVAGATRYFGKYYGFSSSFLYRLKAVLKALFSFRIGLFVALAGGRKIDGTQTEL